MFKYLKQIPPTYWLVGLGAYIAYNSVNKAIGGAASSIGQASKLAINTSPLTLPFAIGDAAKSAVEKNTAKNGGFNTYIKTTPLLIPFGFTGTISDLGKSIGKSIFN